jgi:hypothetical protein
MQRAACSLSMVAARSSDLDPFCGGPSGTCPKVGTGSSFSGTLPSRRARFTMRVPHAAAQGSQPPGTPRVRHGCCGGGDSRRPFRLRRRSRTESLRRPARESCCRPACDATRRYAPRLRDPSSAPSPSLALRMGSFDRGVTRQMSQDCEEGHRGSLRILKGPRSHGTTIEPSTRQVSLPA